MGGALQTKGNVGVGGFVKGRDGSAEWNIYWDAPAAKTVIEAPGLQGGKILLFPLDATDHVPVNSTLVRRFGKCCASPAPPPSSSGGAPPSRKMHRRDAAAPPSAATASEAATATPSVLAQIVGCSWSLVTHVSAVQGAGSYYAWDVLTAAYVLDPTVVRATETVRVAVDAEPGSPSEGRTTMILLDEASSAVSSRQGGVVRAAKGIDAERFYQLVLRACTAC